MDCRKKGTLVPTSLLEDLGDLGGSFDRVPLGGPAKVRHFLFLLGNYIPRNGQLAGFMDWRGQDLPTIWATGGLFKPKCQTRLFCF